MTARKPYHLHLTSAEDLVTPYAATRAGFVTLALEKNRQATPFVQQARALKIAASQAKTPLGLLDQKEIEPALLVAAGVSDKAAQYLQENDRQEALLGLIREYLEPQGDNWLEELVYRFLLTRGDTLGGMMRNIAGIVAQRKITRAIISVLSIRGTTYQYRDGASNLWLPKPENDAAIESSVKGLSWQSNGNERTLIYNIKVPIVNKNVDLCLFNGSSADFSSERIPVTYRSHELYLALGELKGGIDPAGADEHWKTANTALKRIEKAFHDDAQAPLLFFVAAAIEHDMANEIWQQLEQGTLPMRPI